MTGRVILHAVISPEGSVGSVRILSENPPQVGFGPAAVEAVSHWRYRPATQMGRPVAVQFTITVEFTLSR
jgi:TonB family protein